MTRTRLVAVAALLVLGLAYLRDPPWLGEVTSGMLRWEEDPPGTRFRWTIGRASFFVSSAATGMTLPLRAVFPGPNGRPVIVRVFVTKPGTIGKYTRIRIRGGKPPARADRCLPPSSWTPMKCPAG